MKCNVNENTILNKCSEIAQNISDEYNEEIEQINKEISEIRKKANVGTFSTEDDNIYFFTEPNEYLKQGKVKEFVEICRKNKIKDKDIVTILSNNKDFGKQFRDLYNTNEIIISKTISDNEERALIAFIDMISNGIDFESFVKGLIARIDRSTFDKKDPYNTILKRNYSLFKNIKSGKTTFAAVAERVQAEYRNWKDENDNLGADLIADFVNRYDSLTDIKNALKDKVKKLKTVEEKLDYAVEQLSNTLEEDLYFENKRKRITSVLIKHLKNSGIKVLLKTDIEKYFKNNKNSIVLNYYNLKQESIIDKARNIVYQKYLSDIQQYNIIKTLEQLNETYNKFKKIYKDGKYIEERDWGQQFEEVQEKFPDIKFVEKNLRIVPIKPKEEIKEENEEYKKTKKWINELSNEKIISLAQYIAVENNEQFFLTPNGEIYGFVDKNGNLYLDETIIDEEHPIHEYTHLWDIVVAKINPEFWNRGKELMKKHYLWEEISNDPNYGRKWKSIKGISSERLENLIASEVHARLVGQKGKFGINDVIETDDNLIERLKQWLLDFWKEIKSAFLNWNETELQNLTLEDFVNMTLKDFVEGINPADKVNNMQESQITQNKNITTIQGNTIKSTSPEVTQRIADKINEVFPSEEEVKHALIVDAQTIYLNDMKDIVDTYTAIDGINNGISFYNTPINPQNLNYDLFDLANKQYVTDFKKSIATLYNQINSYLENYYNEFDTSKLSNEELQKVSNDYNLLLTQKKALRSILNQLDITNTKNIIDNINTLCNLWINIYKNLSTDLRTSKGILYREIDNVKTLSMLHYLYVITKKLLDNYGNYDNESKVASKITKDSELESAYNQIDKQRIYLSKIINNYEKDFRNKIINEFLMSDEIMSLFPSNTAQKLKELQSEASEGIKDLSKVDRFLFAFDNAFAENTIIPEIVTSKQIQKKVDISKEVDELTTKLKELYKSLKTIGIDLEKKETYEWFFEKFKNGIETGAIIYHSTPEFQAFLNKIYQTNPNPAENEDDENIGIQIKKLKMIHENCDVVNIFKLSVFRNEKNEDGTPNIYYEILNELSGGNYKKLLDNPSHKIYQADENYEKELKEKLGLDYKRVIQLYKNMLVESYQSKVHLNDEFELNPYILIKNILRYNNNLTNEDDILFVENDEINFVFFNYNILPFIPKNKNDFNEKFKEFSEKAKSEPKYKELYDVFNYIYGEKIGSMFMNDSHNRSIAHLKEDWVERSILNLKNKEFRKLFSDTLDSFKELFKTKEDIEKDVNLNNSNYYDIIRYNQQKALSMLSGLSKDEIFKLCKKYNVPTEEMDFIALKSALAYKIADTDYSKNPYKTTLSLIQLYGAQKINNEMTYYAKLLLDLFKNIKTPGNKERKTAIEAFEDQIERNYMGKSPRANENTAYNWLKRKRYSEDDKKMIEIINEIITSLESGDLSSFSFTLDNVKYRYIPEYVGQYKYTPEQFIKYENNQKIYISNEELINKRVEWLNKKIDEIGDYSSIGSLIEGIQSIIRLTRLGGFSLKQGFKNRVDGRVSNNNLDAKGIYWTSGNMARAERAFWFSAWTILKSTDGDYLFDKIFKGIGKKRRDMHHILDYLGNRFGILEDQTNILDKETTSTPTENITQLLNPYNTAIKIPERFNQLQILHAILQDEKIYYVDENGNIKETTIIDKKTLNFTCYEWRNGKLKFKKEFDPELHPELEYNKQWKDFVSTQKIDNNDMLFKKSTDIIKTIKKVIKANRRSNGDYRTEVKKYYSRSLIGSLFMMFKVYFPEKLKNAFSKGENNDEIGEIMTFIQQGTVGTRLLSFFSSSMNFFSYLPATAKLALATITIPALEITHKKLFPEHKTRTLARQLQFDLQVLKAYCLEVLKWIPRIAFKRDLYNTKDYIFQNEKSKLIDDAEKKDQHIGNIIAIARTCATNLYLLALEVTLICIVKSWKKAQGDDDDDELVKGLENAATDIRYSADLLQQSTVGVIDFEQTIMIMNASENSGKMLRYALQNDLLFSEKSSKFFMPIKMPYLSLLSKDEYVKNDMADVLIDAITDYDKNGYSVKHFTKQKNQTRKLICDCYEKAYKNREIPEEELKKWTDIYKKRKKISGEIDLYEELTWEQFKEVYLKNKIPTNKKTDIDGIKYEGKTDQELCEIHIEYIKQRPFLLKHTPILGTWKAKDENNNLILDLITTYNRNKIDSMEEDE